KIKSLPASHNLVYSNGKLTVSKYWDIETTKKINGSDEEKREMFKALFDQSIRQHMRSDVEIGGCLSGGLDSSAIASAIATDFPKLDFKTFTVYYEGKNEVDERPFANEVLSKYPSLRPFYFTPTEEEIADHFASAIFYADVPIAGSSPISQYFVMKLAAEKKVKVVVDGQGADEILGGYMHSFYRLIGGLIKQFRLPAAIAQSSAHSTMQGMPLKKSADVFLKSILSGFMNEQSLYSTEYRNYFPFVSSDSKINFRLNSTGGSRLNQFLYHLTYNTSLPSLLQYEDRNSMAFSIESRVPFLDHRLVEFIFSLGDEDKIHNGVTKKILRDSMQHILPEKITRRKDKKGFVTPGEIKWLRGPLRFLIEDSFSRIDFLNKGKVNSLLSDFKKGDNKNANLIWRIAVLNYWLKRA
ncbi:MAG: asparagine synthase C-terminal domain-containing protein, partial [Bacteroidota bacterium]